MRKFLESGLLRGIASLATLLTLSLGGIYGLYDYLRKPPNLSADIYPSDAVIIDPGQQVSDFANLNLDLRFKPEPSLTRIKKILEELGGFNEKFSRSSSLFRIELTNNSDKPIKDIKIYVRDLVAYNSPSESLIGFHGPIRLADPSQQFIIEVDSILPEQRRTLLAWSRAFAPSWHTIDTDIRISHANGIAEKRFYLRDTWLGAWVSRNEVLTILMLMWSTAITALFVISLIVEVYKKSRSSHAPTSTTSDRGGPEATNTPP